MDIQAGQKLKVVKIDPLLGNKIAPSLVLGEEKEVKEVITCKCGSKHIDVGLISEVNYVTCFECKLELPRGDSIHWCHPSRFEELKQ